MVQVQVQVRLAVAADLPQLMEIASHSETAAQWNPREYQKLFMSETATSETGAAEYSASETVASESGQKQMVLVIEQDGKVSGFVIGHEIGSHQLGGEWEIENIAVTGSAQRSGLGARLLGEFLNLVRERGGRAIFLEVRESNLAARGLYRKLAFVEAGRRKNYYENPPEDALILQFNFP
jgi:ribosomal-protein-alanine acetyltransferase